MVSHAGPGGYAMSVDLGTSNTVVMLRGRDGRVRPLLFDGQPVLPSGVYLDGSGHLHVGRDAQRLAQFDPARFEPTPKQRVDDRTVLLGETEIPVAGLLAALLREIGDRATRAHGFLPSAVLTHPVAWGASRRSVLREAADRAGWPPVQLLPEPVAAARYFTTVLCRPVPDGRALVVFDFGAGTLDIAVVRNDRGRLTLLGSGGLADLGGSDVDAALVGYLGGALGRRDPALWRRLSQPRSTADRRVRRLFWEDVRGAKEMLSRAVVAPVPVSDSDHALHLTRDELERLATPLLTRGIDEAVEVIRRCRLTRSQVVGVFLVGGSSRIPLVARMLHQRLDVPPVILEQPELPVAEGALSEVVSQAASEPVVPPPVVPVVAGLRGAGAPVVPLPVSAGTSAPGGPVASRWSRRRHGVVWSTGTAVLLAVVVVLTQTLSRPAPPSSAVSRHVPVADIAYQGVYVDTEIDEARSYLATRDAAGMVTIVAVPHGENRPAWTRSFGPEGEWDWMDVMDGVLWIQGGSETDEYIQYFMDATSGELISVLPTGEDEWIMVYDDRVFWEDEAEDRIVWLDSTTGEEVRQAPAADDDLFLLEVLWEDELLPTGFGGFPIERAAETSRRVVQWAEDGLLRVFRVGSGAESASATVELTSGDDDPEELAYRGRLLYAEDTDEGITISQRDLDAPGTVEELYSVDGPELSAVGLEACGRDTVCLHTQENGLDPSGPRDVIGVGLGSGAEEFRLESLEGVPQVTPAGDRLVVLHTTPQGPVTTVYDRHGAEVVNHPGAGVRMDPGTFLLFPRDYRGDSSTGVHSIPLVILDVRDGDTRSLGSMRVSGPTCRWSDTHIACVDGESLQVHRLR